LRLPAPSHFVVLAKRIALLELEPGDLSARDVLLLPGFRFLLTVAL
jgi:hypothetical protein